MRISEWSSDVCSSARMHGSAGQIAERLAEHAGSVCRRYLSNGRKEGRYWLVGNVHNAPGRSLYVRLFASPDRRGAAGKWTDAQSGDHGDLLDLIAAAQNFGTMREALDEARHFLSLPLPPPTKNRPATRSKAPTGTPEAARRLRAAAKPLGGSLVRAYLSSRHIVDLTGCEALLFHPSCWYRASDEDTSDIPPAWPAMIAAVDRKSTRLNSSH